MSKWFEGLKWAEQEYQNGVPYIEIQDKIDYPFTYNDFDKGASDYLRHVWANPNIFKKID